MPTYLIHATEDITGRPRVRCGLPDTPVICISLEYLYVLYLKYVLAKELGSLNKTSHSTSNNYAETVCVFHDEI